MFAVDKPDLAGVWQQLRNDYLLHFLLIVLVVSSIPLFLPGLSSEQQITYGWYQSSLIILPMAILLFWPCRKEPMGTVERKMWMSLSLGWGFWWVASIYNTLLNIDPEGFGQKYDFNVDYLYLGYYICWLVALDNAPERDNYNKEQQKYHWLHLSGSIGLALCLFLYFILIPIQLSPEAYNTWVPSFLFYTGLDLFLFLVVVSLLLDSKTVRWKLIYCALMISLLSLMGVDLLAALDEEIRRRWVNHALVNLLWVGPFVFLVLAARFRSYQFPELAQAEATTDSELESSRLLGSPLVLIAIFLLVIHVVLEMLGLVEPEIRPYQGLVVIFGLMLFLILAVVENNTLRHLAAVARQRADELEQLRILHEVEEQSQLAKGRFLANVSHELRTPMNGILGMTELMLLSDMSADQRNRAGLVYSSAESLLKTIDDILEYSKLDAREIVLVQEEFNIEQLAQQVLDLARKGSDQKRIGLQLELSPEIPRCLEGDGARFQQVLMIIASNAFKFTEAGDIRVRFSLAGEAERSVRIRCEVIDTGIGLAPGVERKLFRPLSQVDESTSRRFGGSGLGLAICRKVVEAQGGSIGAFANTTTGATFWFEIDYQRCGSRPKTEQEPGSTG